MTPAVLDATALLALLNDEPGAERVAGYVSEAAIGAVNLTEVIGKLAEQGMPEAAIHTALEALGLDIVPFDEDLAYRAGMLHPQTKTLGLSLGDRACLALGQQLSRPVLTADRIWSRLKIGVEVVVIR